jgi:hypothetical protein
VVYPDFPGVNRRLLPIAAWITTNMLPELQLDLLYLLLYLLCNSPPWHRYRNALKSAAHTDEKLKIIAALSFRVKHLCCDVRRFDLDLPFHRN